MPRFIFVLFLPIVLLAVLPLIHCGDDDDDEDGDCPSFADYQLYPDIGEPDSVFELFVRLKNKSANFNVERIYAQLYQSNGNSGGVTFDLVRTEADHLRYLRTFRGNEVCDSGTCSLYFRVIAEHVKGCSKSFETDIFQVVVDQEDDDTAGDDDDLL